jgi:hypothetical protein
MSINMSVKVARDLVRRAAHLYHQGTGIPIQPLGDEYHNTGEGFIDEIGNEEGLEGAYYWANMLLHFARTVHGILSFGINEIEENNLLEDG